MDAAKLAARIARRTEMGMTAQQYRAHFERAVELAEHNVRIANANCIRVVVHGGTDAEIDEANEIRIRAEQHLTLCRVQQADS